MTHVPQEFKAVLNNRELRQALDRQPFLSTRFKAMVLGLTALQYVNSQRKDGSNSRV